MPAAGLKHRDVPAGPAIDHPATRQAFASLTRRWIITLIVGGASFVAATVTSALRDRDDAVGDALELAATADLPEVVGRVWVRHGLLDVADNQFVWVCGDPDRRAVVALPGGVNFVLFRHTLFGERHLRVSRFARSATADVAIDRSRCTHASMT